MRNLYRVLVFLFLSVTLTPPVFAQDSTNYFSWPYNKTINLNTGPSGASINNELYNFPVLIRLTPDNFEGFAFTQPGGSDVRFSRADGVPLSYQIERWIDNGADNDTADIWVKVDTIRGNNSNQFIRMHWGKTGMSNMSSGPNVFGSQNGYLGVWHLNEEVAGTNNPNAYLDATGAYNGTDYISSTGRSGIIGFGKDFNGTTDYIPLQSAPLPTNAYTISTWIKFNVLNAAQTQNIFNYQAGNYGYGIYTYQTDMDIKAGDGTADNLGYKQKSLVTGQWAYITASWSAGKIKYYRNGQLLTCEDSTACASVLQYTSADTARIGQLFGAGYFNGSLDELQFSSIKRPDDWVKLSYENQKPNQTLVNIENYSSWPASQNFFLNTTVSGLNIANTVTKFPLLIRLNPANFTNFANTSPGGADIRFAKSDGTPLRYEIERWVDNAGNLDTAEIWVRLDTVKGNSNSQFIKMFWGKSGAHNMSSIGNAFTLSDGFRGAWHSDTLLDASENKLNAQNFSTIRTPGLIGFARNYTGSSAWLLGGDQQLNPLVNMTVTAWVNGSSFGGSNKMIISRGSTPDYNLGVNASSIPFANAKVGGAVSSVNGVNPITPSTWHLLSMTYDGSSVRLYCDTSMIGNTASSGPLNKTFDSLFIGKSNVTEYFNGMIDEVQISDVARPIDWIKLQYETQKQNSDLQADQSSFLPIRIRHNIGSGSGDTCLISTKMWSICFSELAGAGIKALYADSIGLTPNQVPIGQNLFNITYNGNGISDSASMKTGVLNLLVFDSTLARIQQTVTISGQTFTSVYTINGAGKIYVRTEVVNTGANASSKLISFTLNKMKNGIVKIRPNTSNAITSSYILLGDSGPNQFDVQLTPFNDWTDATDFDTSSSGTTARAGYRSTNYNLYNKEKDVWEYGIEFAHKIWDDTSIITHNYALNYRSPDSLRVNVGTLAMEKSWENHLLGHWKMDESSGDSAFDYSGRSFNLKVSRSSGQWGQGKWGNALQLSGTDSAFVNDKPAFDIRTDFTIMQWIKTSTSVSTSVTLFSKHDGSNGIKISGDATNHIALQINGVSFQSGIIPSTGVWHHVAVSFNKSSQRVKFFLDGNVDTSINTSALSIIPTAAPVVVGKGFNGSLDDIRYYGDELNEEDVEAIFQRGFNSGAGIYALRANATNAVGIQIDGSTTPRFYPVFSIANWWATNVPMNGRVKLNGVSLTPGVDYIASLDKSNRTLHLGLNKIINQNLVSLTVDALGLTTETPDTVAPANPVTLTAVPISTSAIKVTWNPGAIAADADSVGVWYKTGSHPQFAYDPTSILKGVFPLSRTSDTITGLTPNTNYSFMLAVRDTAGNWSDTSSTAIASATTCESGLKVWDNSSGNNLWNNASNWFPDGVPTTSDSVLFNSTSSTPCILDGNSFVRTIQFTNAYTGVFAFNNASLSISGSIADFRSAGTIDTTGSGTLIFTGAISQTLIPPVNGALPNIVQNGSGETTVLTNFLKCSNVSVNVGTFVFGSGFTHTIADLNGAGSIDIKTSTIKTSGNTDFSNFTSILGTGSIEYVRTSGIQVLTPKSGSVTHPSIAHSGAGTLQLSTNALYCTQFSQTSGILDFGGSFITVVSGGNFSITNGTSSSIVNLTGRTITVAGNCTLTGQTGNYINLDPNGLWYLHVSGSLNVQYAKVANCDASGGVSGQPLNSALLAGNVNWNINAVNPQLFDTTGSDTTIFIKQRTNGTDTVDIWYKLIDSDNSIDTIKMFYRNGAAASWTSGTGTFGDIGSVAGSDSTIKRQIRWYLSGQLGNAFTSDSIQVKLVAKDSNGNSDSLILLSGLKVDTKPPVISSAYPINNLAVNTINVSYTLSKKCASGTISWIRTGGTADASSPHVQSLTISELVIGVHSNILLTNAPPLVAGTIYSIDFNVTDSLGHNSSTVSSSNITYDPVIPVITVSAPVNNAHVKSAHLTYSLSKICATGTVTWTRVGGAADPSSPYFQGLTTSELTAGLHSNILIASSPALVTGTMYRVSFDVSDSIGNNAVTVNIDSVKYDTSSPVITLTSPSAISIVKTTNVSYTIAESCTSGTITWTRDSGNADPGSPHVQILTFAELLAGTYTNHSLTNSPTLVNGTVYTVTITGIDSAGNISSISNASAMSYDTTGPSGPSNVSLDVIDRNGFTKNSYVHLNIAATNADSMRIALLPDTASSLWKQYTAVDSIFVFVGGNGIKRIYGQFKTTLGTRSQWYSDSTNYDTIAPSGGITIIDNNGYTRDTVVQVILSQAGADSVRVAVVNDTATAAWTTIFTTQNLLISGLDGIYKAFSQFKDFAGNITSWKSDSTQLDRTKPTVAISTSGSFNYSSWNSLSGTANDSGSGIDSIAVSIKNSTTNKYWNGTVWESSVKLLRATGTSAWNISLPNTSLSQSSYNVQTYVFDKAGNEVVDSSNFYYYTKPVVSFSANQRSGIFPLVVQFTDSSMGTKDKWKWSFGDGTTDTVQNPLHTYSLAGSFNVTLSVNGPGGADSLVKTSFIVTSSPPLDIMIRATPTTGASPLQVQFSDSLISGLVNYRSWSFGDGSTDTTATPQHTYLHQGVYQAALVSTGAQGIDTEFVTIIVTDTTTPLNVSNLSAQAVNCSTAIVKWDPSLSPDVDSVRLCLSKSSFPTAPSEGDILIHTQGKSVQADTFYHLPGFGFSLFVSTFTKDSSGNWSIQPTKTSVIMPDGIAPEYDLTVSAVNEGDSSVYINVKTATTYNEPKYLLIASGPDKQSLSSGLIQIPYQDTSFLISNINSVGSQYVLTAVKDSSGNISTAHYDSAYVNNSAPIIYLPGDTFVNEDTTTLLYLSATDKNKDSVTFRLINGPSGLDLDTTKGIIRWRPDDQDVGVHMIVVAVSDGRTATCSDSFKITVVNVNEKPTLQYVGSKMAYEDSSFRGLLVHLDPDLFDSISYETVLIPAWMSLNGDTLIGQPQNRNVGVDTIAIIIRDKADLRDTLIEFFNVVNTNDPPEYFKKVFPDSIFEKKTFNGTVSFTDQDKGDSLQIVIQSGPNWLKISSLAFDKSAQIFNVTLTGYASQRDTGKSSFTIDVRDKAGSHYYFTDTLIVRDANDPPVTGISQKQIAGGAVRYLLNGHDDRDSAVVYNCKLTLLSDSSFVKTYKGINPEIHLYPLIDGTYQFSAWAQDAQGLTDTGSVKDTFTISGASVNSWSDTSWQMISIPAGSYQSDSLKENSFLVHWDENIPIQQVFYYYKQKETISSINAGSSYWRKSGNSIKISLNNSDLVKTPTSIKLTKGSTGWNQIASPFVYPVRIDKGNSTVWRWNALSHDYEDAGDILEPWQGYWFMADSSYSITIDTIPVFSTSKLAKRAHAFFADINHWNMQVSLKTTTNQDVENTFGVTMSPVASTFNKNSIEPPRIDDAPYLFFIREDKKGNDLQFSSDIRRQWESLNSFNFGIGGKKGSGEIRFSGIPTDVGIYVFMSSGDSMISVNNETNYHVEMNGSAPIYKTLFVTGDKEFKTTAPMVFKFLNPYPNPVRAATQIKYTLPFRWDRQGKLIQQPYKVHLIIYDAKGRIIRDLLYRQQNPGSYSTVWNGKTNTCRMATSGAYFITISADDRKAVNKMLMIR